MQNQNRRPLTATRASRSESDTGMVSGSGLRLSGASQTGGMLLAEIAIGLKVCDGMECRRDGPLT